MFARLLAEIEADRRDRATFRDEVRARFDKGSERMDEIHVEVKKTNGRVTRIEQAEKERLAKLAGIAFAATAIAQGLLWLVAKGWLSLGG